MKQDIVSVFDSAVQAFMRPMFVPRIAAGVRAFTDEVNRAGSEINNHPEDYAFYHLGVFDDEFGKFEVLESPVLIVRGKDVIAKG